VRIIGLFVISVLSVVGLISYERRRAEPLIDVRFFRSVPFSGATIIAMCAFASLAGFLFVNTLYLQDVRGYDALHAGLLTVPMAVGTVIASPLSGRLTAAHGPRRPLLAAGALVAVAAVLLTQSTALPVLLLAYLLFGAGMGMVNAPITTTAVAGLPRAQAGVSAAITTTGRQVGNSVGVAVIGSLVTQHATGHAGWWVLAGCGALIAVLGTVTTPATTRITSVARIRVSQAG
jgi:predicted MFS family arabinose efflux permease